MNTILKAILPVTVWALLLSGCATSQNLITNGTYAKEIISAPQTSLGQIWAVENDNGFKISGSLRRTGRFADIPNYVQVTLVNQNDEVMDKQKVNYYPTSLSGGKGRRSAKFSALFNASPPPGTTIRISMVD